MNRCRYCREQGIALVAYCPIGSPGNAAKRSKFAAPPLIQNPAILRVANAVGKTSGQVLLRWHLERGVAVIPKSTSEKHILENKDIFRLVLMAVLGAVSLFSTFLHLFFLNSQIRQGRLLEIYCISNCRWGLNNEQMSMLGTLADEHQVRYMPINEQVFRGVMPTGGSIDQFWD